MTATPKEKRGGKQMLYQLCNKCQKVIKYPSRYCDECQEAYQKQQAERKQKSNQRYNKQRDPKYLRFYKSVAWQKLTQTYLQDKQYKCEHKGKRCSILATESHHIQPIQTKAGWDRRLDYDNLLAVCVQCHNEIHNRFK